MRRHLLLFIRFLQFGLLAWGGPVAQIGMLRRELVEKEGWISSEKFNRVLAVYQALPGPEAHELCVYLGMVRAGRVGAILAGLGFMLPGVLLMVLLGWAYQAIGPAALLPLFAGVKPAVAALIFRALHRIGSHALTRPALAGVAATSVVLTLLGAHFLPVLLGGVTYVLWTNHRKILALLLLSTATAALALFGHFMVTDAAPLTAASMSSPTLFLEGLKAGMLSFGGAYTAIPFVEEGMVGKAPNITPEVFLDAVAFANVIPAPLVSFTTFLGYMTGGLSGAWWITLGVFLPAFSFTLLDHHYLEQAVEYRPLHSFLDGVTAGVVGIFAVTAVKIALHSVTDILAGLIFAGTLAALYIFKSPWTVPVVVLAAGLIGWLL